MRTDEEAWLREQLRLDAPPPMTPLDGMETLSRGRSRRRRHRIATATPLAVVGVAVLGTALWAGQLLPDAVQDALPAVSGVSEQCPDLAPIETSSTSDGGAGFQVTSDVAHLTVLDWVAADGTSVLVIRTLPSFGCGQVCQSEVSFPSRSGDCVAGARMPSLEVDVTTASSPLPRATGEVRIMAAAFAPKAMFMLPLAQRPSAAERQL